MSSLVCSALSRTGGMRRRTGSALVATLSAVLNNLFRFCSSPAKALRKAEELYVMIANVLYPSSASAPTSNTSVSAASVSVSDSSEVETITKRLDLQQIVEHNAQQLQQAQTAVSATTITAAAAMITLTTRANTDSAVSGALSQEALEAQEFLAASRLVRSRSVDALPPLRSVFALQAQLERGRDRGVQQEVEDRESEPSVTNWAAGFVGYVFV